MGINLIYLEEEIPDFSDLDEDEQIIDIEKVGAIIPKISIIGKIDRTKKKETCPGNICITGFDKVSINNL